MDSFHHFTNYLAEYGYLAIFLLVFFVQIGVPNPLTNELLLMFCGYLSYIGTLNMYKAIIVAVVADCIGSVVIFLVFYFFTKWLVEHSPKWLPLTGEKIEKMKTRVLSRGMRGLFIVRMTPLIRGYASVVAGMLTVNRRAFTGTVIVSAIIWNAGLIITGKLVGPYWNDVMSNSGMMGKIILLVVVLVIILFIGRYFQRKEIKEGK